MTTMKTIYNKIAGVAMVAAVAGSMASCVSENPFATDGEGLVKMNVSVNPTVTRATPSNIQELQDKCVIYVSNEKGLLHKWTGVDNVPSELYLRYGNYTAEAWSGDSVSAAYESEGKKFFKGIKEFNVDNATVQVDLRCTLANVVASVEESTIDNNQIKDVKVTFSSSKGSLSFDSSNWADKAYFMMSSADKDSEGLCDLNYVVEFKNARDEPFTKNGIIKNVQSAHDYRLNFEYHSAEPTDGGAFVQIVIDDNIVTETADVTILGKPAFAWDQADLEVGEQIVGEPGQFVTHTLRMAAYGGFESIDVIPVDKSMFVGHLPSTDGFDLIKMSDDYKLQLADLGIEIATLDVEEHENDVEGIMLHKYVLRFTDKWLNSLPANDNPYELTVVATDLNDKKSETIVSIANTQKAIAMAAPVNVDANELSKDFTAVKSRSVTLPLTFDDGADLANAAVQYREVGAENWQTQSINLSRATATAYVILSNLNPSTEYEYRTVAGQIVDGEYELKSKVATFTTESVFTFPNASFEDWSTYSAKTMLGTKTVTLPGSTGDKATSFWGSGNEGSATANMTLTDKSTDMVHSGTYSARLESKSALGVLAAGNIFVGEYVRTDGTNGVLSVGREYDGSHPSAVSVWVNYRPGAKVSVKSGNEEFLPSGFAGGNDHGQIYIALTTGPVELRTNPSDRKLFDSNGAEVIAYGEVTWTGNFGPDGGLENVKIPFVYNDKAKTQKPTHLVIVSSASKYGDYFSGSAGSIMYLDDFELVYE